MVFEEPPAPAERVELGRAAAGARRRTALAPWGLATANEEDCPGVEGDEGRLVSAIFAALFSCRFKRGMKRL